MKLEAFPIYPSLTVIALEFATIEQSLNGKIMFEAYLITLIGVAVAQAAPGPNLFAVASAALGQGRTAALFVTLGVSTGMLIWAVAIAFGLGALFATYPLSLTLLKFIGGGYLLWLAARALRSAWSGNISSIATDDSERTGVENWKRGMLVVLTNPKAALMWSAVGTILFAANLSHSQVALFGPIGATSGFLIYGGYALLFSTGSASKFYSRFARPIEATLGASFGTLGGKLIIDGAREIRG